MSEDKEANESAAAEGAGPVAAEADKAAEDAAVGEGEPEAVAEEPAAEEVATEEPAAEEPAPEEAAPEEPAPEEAAPEEAAAEKPAGEEAAAEEPAAEEPASEEAAAEEPASEEPAAETPQYDYHALHEMNVAQLREVAATIEHEAVHGYTTMHKEHLVPAICTALGIEAHEHHEVVGIDKEAIKAKIRELKKDRDEAEAAGDKARLKLTRRRIRGLKRKIRRATV